MENINAEQAIEILEKFDFFQGQRAGRELWKDKPFDVQEQDIANFSRDVALLKNYIEKLTEEIDSLKQCMEHEHASFMEIFGEYGEKCERLSEENERLKAEKKADLEKFAERIKRYYTTLNGKTNSNLVAYHIDEVLKEMIGEAK